MNTAYDQSKIFSELTRILEKNGPDPEEYGLFLRCIDDLKTSDTEPLRRLMKPILTPETIIGFSFTKPMGYNGDFFIIEKIYQGYVNPDPNFSKWDRFFHTSPAAIAVINRKELAKSILANLHQKNFLNKDVLVLGSGPAREIFEYMQVTPDNTLSFDLVDLDPRSISYASNRNKTYLNSITFHHNNVIRFQPEKNYDLIWSAGLFDYFKDKHFVYLVKRYYQYLKPGGQMIIGNFNSENPARKVMEVLCDWFLIHRSEAELLKYSTQAGVPTEEASVQREPLGINLFLTITKTQ